MQIAYGVLQYHLWPVWLYHVFPHYPIKDTIFGGWGRGELLKVKCVFFILSTNLSETFNILRKIRRDVIKMYVGLHVRYPLILSDFNATYIFSTDFRKTVKYEI